MALGRPAVAVPPPRRPPDDLGLIPPPPVEQVREHGPDLGHRPPRGFSPPDRSRCRARNHRANTDKGVWWCHPTRPRVPYSPNPHSPLAFRKSCSTLHRFDRIPATAAGGTSGGAFVRWYFTSGSCPTDRRTSNRSGPDGSRCSLNHTRTSAYAEISGPWLPSATVTRRHAPRG